MYVRMHALEVGWMWVLMLTYLFSHHPIHLELPEKCHPSLDEQL